MMNEFPPVFLQAHRRLATDPACTSTMAINGTEDVDLLAASGVAEATFPLAQAVGQHHR